MPISYVLQDGVLLVTAEGQHGLAEVRSALDSAIASPDFSPPMCILVDARESEANPPVGEIREWAAYLGSIGDHFLPSWVLVVRGSLRYGLSRMLSVFTEEYGIELHVLRDFEEGVTMARELAG